MVISLHIYLQSKFDTKVQRNTECWLDFTVCYLLTICHQEKQLIGLLVTQICWLAC